jgi:hypothetical protein
METFKALHLSKLFWVIETYYPECAKQQLKDYCTQSDEHEKSGDYFYGYNSLKWALHAVNEIDPKAVKDVFRNIIFEYIARGFGMEKIQYDILNFGAMHQFKAQLRQRITVDIDDFQIIPIGPYEFLINETNQSLANRAFIKTSADAILFRNPEKLSAGITFRMNSGLNQLTGFKHYLINELLAIEPGWKSIGDNSALIINHGHTSKTPTIITISQIIKIIESYNFD